jgi:hypothetical protein
MIGRTRAWLVGGVVGVVGAAADVACSREGCVGDEPGCVVPSPCEALAFTCAAGKVEIRTITRADEIPDGPTALGSIGDFRLANDRIVAVIEALDHPHYLAPSGGNLIDLTTLDGTDRLGQVFQATGLLPGDAVFYDEARVLEGEGFAALQLRGHLDGRPALRVATRYEVRPCEPGIRVRTEIVNDGAEPQTWTGADAFYWGGRRSLPFVPGPNRGFLHTVFGLEDIDDAFEDAPYLLAGTNLEPGVTYAHVLCDARGETGFHSEVITAVGTSRKIVQPRDYVVFERFIAVGETSAFASAGDVALEVRRQLFDEPFAELRGQVVVTGDPGAYLGAGLRATVQVSRGTEETADEARVPVTHTTIGADGRFAVRVPAGADYVVEVGLTGSARPRSASRSATATRTRARSRCRRSGS